jgi:subtilisin family serine protease
MRLPTLACVLLLIASSGASAGITERLERALRSAGADDRLVIWVFFTDRGTQDLQKTAATGLLSERAIERRRNVLPEERLVDETDLPLEESYIRQLAPHCLAIRQRSRWFNGVSLVACARDIPTITALPFVREVELVARFRRRQEEAVPPPGPALGKETATHALSYGPSFGQLNLMNVPAVHDAGNHAEGILVGVFDNGFRLPNHQAFDSLKILATRDFVDHKESVVPLNPNTAFGSHGVYTLSTIGGYAPGKLIGPAFKATYILARTENDSSETPIEEDNWVAAIEWAESLGVQVTSTSLGYLEYDAPYASWTWQDMNGHTTVISRAATMAARKGIVVVNAAGNEYSNANHNTLIAPADADSIITAGAVNPDGTRAGFSSVGPTTDNPPRIKPDVMAQGVAVYAASAVTPTNYAYNQGTSFACPLTAGVASLLLKERPTATPMMVIRSLRNTASRASAPDRFYGWGIVNAAAALRYLQALDSNGNFVPTSFLLKQNYPNPFNMGTTLEYELPEASTVWISVYDILGREVRTLLSGDEPQGLGWTMWDGTDNDGMVVATGVYLVRFEAHGASGSSSTTIRKMMLLR